MKMNPPDSPVSSRNRPLYRYEFGVAPAVKTIRSGEIATVEVPDSDALGPDMKPLEAHLFQDGLVDRGNPVYGPIAVEGAEPGDALQIDLLAVRPTRGLARTLLAPVHGIFPEQLDHHGPVPRRMYHWNVGEKEATLANPLGRRKAALPIRPFPGCIAVALPETPAPSSMKAGTLFGGNLDHPDLTAGSTLWLPVRAPGGLLYMGDMHAAQGHGECTGGGLEISGEIRFRVTLHKNVSYNLPRYQTPEGIACLASETDFRVAARTAIAGMAQWLAELDGDDVTANDVFDYAVWVTECCELRTGGVNNRFVVSCFIPNRCLSHPLQQTEDGQIYRL